MELRHPLPDTIVSKHPYVWYRTDGLRPFLVTCQMEAHLEFDRKPKSRLQALLTGHPLNIVVKIIKRNRKTVEPETAPTIPRPSRTVTTTVNGWISESRKNRLDDDSSSRKTIADWTAEAKI
jgi:hypothetical protein